MYAGGLSVFCTLCKLSLVLRTVFSATGGDIGVDVDVSDDTDVWVGSLGPLSHYI